ncbi:MAG: hypothetical protein V1885_03185 [Candidatus Brennerbacteria bacterium]
MALEDLERKLFGARKKNKGTKPIVPPVLPEPPEVSDAPLTLQERIRLITRSVVLAVVAVLAVSAVVGGTLYLFFSREASRGIILTIEAPEEVMSGVPFDLTVSAENEIDGIVREAKITVHLPENITALGALNGGNALVEESIGDIGGRSVVKKVFRLIAVGEPGTEREIEASIDYTSGGRSRFKTDERTTLSLGEPAIRVTTNIPDRVIGNSSFEFKVEYENVSPFDFMGTTLEVRYPSNFVFESASLPPDSLSNYWRLGALNARSKGTLIIKGSIASTGETAAAFPIVISANFFGKDYTVLTTDAEVALAPSPLVLSATVNGVETYVARAGDFLTYLIRYENRSGVALADVVLKAVLAGEMYETGSVGTQGKVDQGSVTWDATNVPAFRLLDAGASGEVALSVPLKSSFPIRRLSDKNFSVRLTVTAESPTVPSYLQADKTSATTIAETKLSGSTSVDAKALYRDAGSAILNAGPFPPKAGTATEYTVHWVVKNYATDVEKVKIRAALPPEVEWTGMVKANGDSVPLFEESTREVVWTIDRISAAKGVVNAPLEAIFQVRATPTSGQVGNFQTILFGTSLEAADMWTGLALTFRDGALSTVLGDDPTVAPDQGHVVP